MRCFPGGATGSDVSHKTKAFVSVAFHLMRLFIQHYLYLSEYVLRFVSAVCFSVS